MAIPPMTTMVASTLTMNVQPKPNGSIRSLWRAQFCKPRLAASSIVSW